MKTEINLLSPDAKKNRIIGIRTRRINAITDALLVCLVLAVCSYGAAFWTLSSIGTSLDKNVASDIEVSAETKQRIRDINAIIAVVDDRITKDPLWSPLISDIVARVPSGISITTLQLTETPQTLLLVGKATRGSAVVQYQRELEKLSWVERVDAPLQNFAVSPNATVTFTIFRKVSLAEEAL